jgi:hypothetical protein
MQEDARTDGYWAGIEGERKSGVAGACHGPKQSKSTKLGVAHTKHRGSVGNVHVETTSGTD